MNRSTYLSQNRLRNHLIYTLDLYIIAQVQLVQTPNKLNLPLVFVYGM